MSTRATTTAGIAAATLALALAALWLIPNTTPTPTAATATEVHPTTADDQQALAELDRLTVAAPTQTPYNRKAFGQRWADTDHNGCDQRNDTLRRDLTNITTKPGTHNCVILTGTLTDPYTGKTIPFTRGPNSDLVQIDHIVPLAWAWRHGADNWTPAKREQFANDPTNLLAVDGPTNTTKGDQGPALWMPPQTSYHCRYAQQFTATLTRYALAVSVDDRNALSVALRSCTKANEE